MTTQNDGPPQDAARRPAGAGSVDALPSGKFRVRVRLPSGKRITHIVATRDEAESLRRGLVTEIAAANAVEAITGAPTLATFGTRFLDDREEHGVRSIRTERSTWRQHSCSARGAPPGRSRRSAPSSGTRAPPSRPGTPT